MKIKNISRYMMPGVMIAVLFAGCNATDVVAHYAGTSFHAVVAASGSPAQGQVLVSPEGDQLRIYTEGSAIHAAFILNAQPFLAAGLDRSRLPDAAGITYAIENDVLTITFDLGSSAQLSGTPASLDALFSELVRVQRQRIGYHEKLDHFGIQLGNGNVFEWAKDLTVNDKDIVFALNPAPFIAAGVDPSKIAGWLYTDVESKNAVGKKVVSKKLLRPFNLV